MELLFSIDSISSIMLVARDGFNKYLTVQRKKKLKLDMYMNIMPLDGSNTSVM
jgi:hypothetical protein